MKSLIFTLLFLTSYAHSTVIFDKETLEFLNTIKVNSIDTVITADRSELEATDDGSTKIAFFLERDGKQIPIISPIENFNCVGNKIDVIQDLKFANYFEIKQKRVFQLKTEIKCKQLNTYFFASTSNAGQAMTIWEIAIKSVQKLISIGRIDFWKNKIIINWPSNGDYYTFNSVHLTRGDYWDVVGHELGHAIYDQAKIGVFGGGAHKIDECYTHALALSEGWASFFSAYLSLDLNDTDAKFQYMVPRRAPLRIEQIPDDVCASEKNEWRVTGWLWDLIDLSADQEQIEKSFLSLWDLTLNKKFKKTSDIARLLISRGNNQQEITNSWSLNFLDNLP